MGFSLLSAVLLAATIVGCYSDIPLGRSEALVVVHNGYKDAITLGVVIDICYKCSVTPLEPVIPASSNQSFVLDTSHSTELFINVSHSGLNLCNITKGFSEHAQYTMVVNSNGKCSKLSVIDDQYGQNQYLPILYAVLVLLLLSVLWILLTLVSRLIVQKGLLKYCHLRAVDRAAARDLGTPDQSNPSSNYGSTDEQKPLVKSPPSFRSTLIKEGTRVVEGESGKDEGPPKKTRLMSLDAFRGFSLVIMIFVNYGGGGYSFFAHSKWNGLTVADLVFPWFVWIMGVSLVFSFSGRQKDPVWRKLYQIIRRTVILFGLGLFLNSNEKDFKLTNWRIPGVLQRFAVCYFVVAITELISKAIYSLQQNRIRFSCWGPVKDLTTSWIQWILILVLEFVSLMFTFLLSDENCPAGYLGPGGISEGGAHQNCTGGAYGIIDRWFFGENHIYQHPTAADLYKLHQPFDPEGLLSTVNSIVICLLGVQAGRVLVTFKGSHVGIIIRFLLWGVALGVLAALLCEGQTNEGLIPVNKNLWSLSYTLAMAGSGFILLALFYSLIDVVRVWNGAPFKYPGMNSILVYVSHEVFQDYFPFSWPDQGDTHLKFLSANLVGTGLWVAIAYYCFYIEFFVKI